MKQLLANEDYISFHTHRGFYTPTDQHFQKRITTFLKKNLKIPLKELLH